MSETLLSRDACPTAGKHHPTAALRRCPGCGEQKPPEAFWLNRARPSGRATYCRACGHPELAWRPKALLSTEPLLAPLQKATGARGYRGSRKGESGVHRLAARMQAMYGGPYERYRIQIDRILRGELTRIHYTSADRIALALGRHPAQLWGSHW